MDEINHRGWIVVYRRTNYTDKLWKAVIARGSPESVKASGLIPHINYTLRLAEQSYPAHGLFSAPVVQKTLEWGM